MSFDFLHSTRSACWSHCAPPVLTAAAAPLQFTRLLHVGVHGSGPVCVSESVLVLLAVYARVCVCWRWRAPFPGSLLFLFYVIYALRSVSFDSFRCGGTEQKLTQIDDDDDGDDDGRRNGGNAIVPPCPAMPLPVAAKECWDCDCDVDCG